MRPKVAISCCPIDCLERYALTLVDAHLVCVPSLGTLTARGLTGGDLQVLGGQTDGTLDAELLVLGTVDELLADFLEALDVAGGEGDADLETQSVNSVVRIELRGDLPCGSWDPHRSPSRACCKTSCRVGVLICCRY